MHTSTITLPVVLASLRAIAREIPVSGPSDEPVREWFVPMRHRPAFRTLARILRDCRVVGVACWPRAGWEISRRVWCELTASEPRE
jgi:hypothetical protein